MLQTKMRWKQRPGTKIEKWEVENTTAANVNRRQTKRE